MDKKCFRAIRFSIVIACVLLVMIAVWHFGCEGNGSGSCDYHWDVLWQLSPTPIAWHGYSFSPNGEHFAAVELTGKALIYEVSSGRMVASWDTGQDEAYGAIYSPSGWWLATIGLKPRVQIWDLRTRQVVARSEDGLEKISNYEWSPDGTLLMAISHRDLVGKIFLWDALTMKQVAVLSGHTDQITGDAFSPDGDVIASVGYDGTLRVWDAKTFDLLKTLREHRDRILCLAFSPDGKYLVTGGLRTGGILPNEGDKNLLVWDTGKWQVVHRLDNKYAVTGLEFQPGGDEFVALDGYYRRRWNPASGRCLGEEKRALYAMDMAVYAPDGKHAITMHYDEDPSNQVLKVWNIGPRPASAAPAAGTPGAPKPGAPDTATTGGAAQTGAPLLQSAQPGGEDRSARAAPDAGAAPAAGAVFFGLPVRGRRVAFLVTRGGGMTDTMEDVKQLLKRSVEGLARGQAFDVIFWRAGAADEQPGGMAPATAANKEAASEFIDPIVPAGQTDPEHGLRAAFAARPDEVYLFTYGEFDPAVPDLVGRLNKDRAVVVNVVHLTWPRSNPDARKVMRKIAAENGGAYVVTSPSDIRLRVGLVGK